MTGKKRSGSAQLTGGEEAQMVVAFQTAGEGSLRGRVLVAGEPEQPFAGWLGLLAALDGAIKRLGAAAGVAPEQGEKKKKKD